MLNEWQKMWQECADRMFHPPKNPDEVRRNYFKSLSKDELWLWHDEIVKEIKCR